MSTSTRSLALAALLLCGPLAVAAELEPWQGPPQAPSTELATPDGTPLPLVSLRGRVVLVNFWATWCEPCVEEMPSMQRLRERLGTQGFEILAVNFKEGPQRIDGFMRKMRLDFPVVRDDDGAAAKAWNVRIFPSSFVLDAQGNIRYTISGPIDWTSRAVEARIRALLARPTPASGE